MPESNPAAQILPPRGEPSRAREAPPGRVASVHRLSYLRQPHELRASTRSQESRPRREVCPLARAGEQRPAPTRAARDRAALFRVSRPTGARAAGPPAPPPRFPRYNPERRVSTMNIKTFGEVDARSRTQLETCMKAGDAEFGVLCADHHPGYSQPIGGAIAYEGYVSPSGVGYDIGCGNKAVKTDIAASDLGGFEGVERVMTEIAARISFGMGVPAQERTDHPVLDAIREAPFTPQRKMLDLAASQLGTVGSGNHYVNVFADEDDAVWVGVHFGSRGLGHKTASGFLAVAQGLPFSEGERKRQGLKVSEGEMD